MKKTLLFLLISLLPFTLFSQTVFINEIHYDNDGGDVNEGIEVAGPAGTDLTGWKLVPYNGSGGAPYTPVVTMSGTIPDQANGYGTLWFNLTGLQNGAPDGIALIDASLNVVQFLSYEGSFTAVGGDADGLVSTDIGVSQISTTPIDNSMQLQGTGTDYSSFTWATDIAQTRGLINTGQTFGSDTEPPLWSDGFPKLLNILDTRGDLHVSLDEPGTVYYVVLPNDATPPTSEEVKAGVNYGTVTVFQAGSVTVTEASTEYIQTIDGATPGESYDIYVVAEDAAAEPNLQASPTLFDVTMTGARSLVIVSPQANDTYNIGSTVTFQWTSENITNIIIGGYDQAHGEYFVLTNEQDEPFIIDASLGSFEYTIPNSVSTDVVDIIMYDAADISFFTTVTPVNLVDEVDPAIQVLYPEPGDELVPLDATLYAYFDEEIYAGTGNVVIKKSDNTVFETFDITTAAVDGAIEIEENTIIIRPSQLFSQTTKYFVEMDPGVVKDYKDNEFGGISGIDTWSFTTLTVPTAIFFDNFEGTDLSPWTVFNASGATKTWELYSGAARINPYGSTELEEDWLISPSINASAYTALFLSFDIYYNYGTDNAENYLKLYYSTNYDGNTANIGTATWTEIIFDTPLSTSQWTPSGILNLPDLSQPVYFAFKYNYSTQYREWRFDNFLFAGLAPAGTDASLSDLMIDGTTIDGFNPATISYNVVLPAGSTTPPVITFTPTDSEASGFVTDATDLTGDEAARTSTITVTAADGTTSKIYSVRFDPIIEVSNLAALRAITDFSRIYKVAGEVVVTATVSNYNQKWMQDGTAGIQIHDPDGIITTTYVLGDGITGITGSLLDYYGMLELIPYADPGATSSSGLTVTPQVLTVNEFKTNHEDYESELVSIEEVTFSAADGTATFANGTNYVITVGEDATVLRTHFYNTTVTGTVIPATASVTGVAIWHHDEAKISPRFIEDIVLPTGAETTLAERMRIYPVPVRVELTLENIIGAKSLDIIDMTGSRIIYRNIEGQNDYRLNVSELPRGIYFIRIKTDNEVITRKFIKE